MTHKQDLRTLCECVVDWARIPGKSDGSPYSHDFVQIAYRILEQLDREDDLNERTR